MDRGVDSVCGAGYSVIVWTVCLLGGAGESPPYAYLGGVVVLFLLVIALHLPGQTDTHTDIEKRIVKI